MAEVQFMGKSMVRIVDLDFPPIKIYDEKVTFMAELYMSGERSDYRCMSVDAHSIVEASKLVKKKARRKGLYHSGFRVWRLGPGG